MLLVQLCTINCFKDFCFRGLLLVPFWEIINWQISHFGNQNKGVRMKSLGILHDFRIFFIGNGSFNRFLRKTRKILVFKTFIFLYTCLQWSKKNWLRFPPIIHQILMTIRHSYYISCIYIYIYIYIPIQLYIYCIGISKIRRN